MSSTYIEEAVYQELLTDSGVSAIVSTRVYQQEAPANPTYPYIMIFKIDDPNNRFEVGQDGGNPRFQIDAITKDTGLTSALALGKAVRDCLKDFQGSMDGITVKYTMIGSERTFREPEEVIRISQDFIFQYNRS